MENNTSQPLEASIFNKETMKSKEGSILETADCENLGIGESDNQIQHHLKAVDKLAFTHDILTKSLSKESFSNR